MGGGLIQLVAYGIQDIYLMGNPQITFYKIVYKRYTNFSIEPIRQFFSSRVDFGKSVTCTLSRNGDLISHTYLFIQLPFVPAFKLFDNETLDPIKKFAWVKKIGYALIKQIDVEIGGQLIDSHYGDWLNIWSELTNYHDGLSAMIGDIDELTIPTNGKQGYGLYIPLEFWFCKYSGLALPIVSLQYSEIKIHLELREAEEVYVLYPTHCIHVLENIVGMEFMEYIEQEVDGQKIGALFDSFDSITNKLYYTKLIDTNGYNMSINKNFSDPITGERTTTPIIGKQSCVNVFPDPNKEGEIKLKNILDKPLSIANGYLVVDYIYLDTEERNRFAKSNHEFLIQQVQYPGEKIITNNSILCNLSFIHPVKEMIWVVQLNNISNGQLNEKFNYSNDFFKDEVNNRGINIIKKASLLLNGHARFQEREGNYFNWVQPYERHKRSPSTGINVYSFSLFPEENQPSGSCNMSKIDDIKIKIEFDGTISSNNTASIRVYMINYNVLRIIHGLGGLAFSS
jgi:hypothetical protein